MLYRRRDIKRMFAYSSIEHMGIIVFAFGMGGPLANFAGLLHMTMHSLTKSAIFFAVGHIAQVKGTQRIADIRGLTVTHPLLGWSLVVRRVRHRRPAADRHLHERVPDRQLDLRARTVARAAAGFGLLVAFGALVLRLQGMAFGAPTGATAPAKRPRPCRSSRISRLVLMAGIYLPPPLVTWFQHVAATVALRSGDA